MDYHTEMNIKEISQAIKDLSSRLDELKAVLKAKGLLDNKVKKWEKQTEGNSRWAFWYITEVLGKKISKHTFNHYAGAGSGHRIRVAGKKKNGSLVFSKKMLDEDYANGFKPTQPVPSKQRK